MRTFAEWSNTSNFAEILSKLKTKFLESITDYSGDSKDWRKAVTKSSTPPVQLFSVFFLKKRFVHTWLSKGAAIVEEFKPSN
jgi:hypothetical protein